MVKLKGKIFSGVGHQSSYIEKLQACYEKKLGVKLFSGTLNIQLDAQYNFPKKFIRLDSSEYGGKVSINIIQCKIFERSAFILRTDKTEQGTGRYPKTVIEVASDISLRDTYRLKDGDEIEIEVDE